MRMFLKTCECSDARCEEEREVWRSVLFSVEVSGIVLVQKLLEGRGFTFCEHEIIPMEDSGTAVSTGIIFFSL